LLTYTALRVIETLETLKREAADVTRKVEETDVVMAEVEQVTSEYLPLAQASSSIFFVLDELNLLHHFYQFSLRFFLDIFDFVLLRNPSLKDITDPQRRLAILISDLFLHVFKRTSRALLHSDHLTLAVLLAQVKLRGTETGFDEYEFSFVLEGGEGGVIDAVEVTSTLLDASQRQRLQSFSRLACFKDVRTHIAEHEDEWRTFLASNNPETVVPTIWQDLSRELSSMLLFGGLVR
jgi:dynein heavy chain 1